MVKLEITTDIEEVVPTIQAAINAEIKKLEIGLRKTEKAIDKFENKYDITSEIFIKEYTAENLEGGDEEYISWMGELKLRDSLLEELYKLKDIEYVSKGIHN